MKISFPYMGSTIIYSKLFNLLGHQVIEPSRPTRKTINLGVKYSPEFACFPFKVIMGTYLESIEKGADTIVTSGGNGPCRAGYYGNLHQKLLDDLGKKVDFIIFDDPKRDLKDFIQKIKKLKKDISWFKVYKTIKTVYRMAQSLDRLNKEIQVQRAYITNKIKFNQSWEKILAKYKEIRTEKEIKTVEKEAWQELNKFKYTLPTAKKRIRIGIIGEIYVVMEPSVNKDIEKMLNDFGVEVRSSHYISEWVKENLFPFKPKETKEIMAKGKKYIEIVIGGHAQQSIGHIIDFKEKGFDGVIHLKPFGCLPEIVSQSMLDNISEKVGIPILTLSIDEQMARANVLTRIEAFLDLVKKRKDSLRKEG